MKTQKGSIKREVVTRELKVRDMETDIVTFALVWLVNNLI